MQVASYNSSGFWEQLYPFCPYSIIESFDVYLPTTYQAHIVCYTITSTKTFTTSRLYTVIVYDGEADYALEKSVTTNSLKDLITFLCTPL